MKFSRKWLEHWLGRAVEIEPLVERLTLAGLEVDAVASLDCPAEVVVGRVTALAPHPDADRLKIASVDDGDRMLQIVCGAPNVAVDQHVAVARVGATLPGGLRIRRSKLRGVSSEGMLCSASELGLGDDHDGILELPPSLAPGTVLAEALELPDDVIDVDLTPNRGDCFSLLGVAREVAAFSGDTLDEPPASHVDLGGTRQFAARVADLVKVPRFTLRIIEGIDPQAATPLWMVERLRRSGIRAIHPVVDITNYVMLEYGQPMHAYDLDKLNGDIDVRAAVAGERLTLLDGRVIDLLPGTLLICDASGPIGLAGIMGGLSTAVDERTRNVLFEAALFTPAAMAGQARRYGLHTDASLRFERGVHPGGHERAQARAANLLVDIAGGTCHPLLDLVDPDSLPRPPTVTLRHERLTRALGHRIDAAEVDDIFARLGFDAVRESDVWQVTAPGFRYDINIEEDLIEEVARVFGYDRIPARRAYSEVALAPDTEHRVDEARIADTLSALGYNEAICYSFVDPERHALWDIAPPGPKLLNPLSRELSVMRGSLLPGLTAAAAYNVARQQPRIRLFESGHVFSQAGERLMIAGIALGPRVPEHWDSGGGATDFFDIKSTVDALNAFAGRDQPFDYVPARLDALHPGQSASVVRDGDVVGVVGALHPRLAEAYDFGAPVFVFELDFERVFSRNVPGTEPISRYPHVRRDIAVVVDAAVASSALVASAKAAAPALLDRVVVFDVYQGKGIEAGRKSIALGLILKDSSRTLTDSDTDAAVAAVVDSLQRDHGAQLRE